LIRQLAESFVSLKNNANVVKNQANDGLRSKHASPTGKALGQEMV